MINRLDEFWQLADETKLLEQYRIDHNLKYLQSASLPVLQQIFVQYQFFTQYYINDLAILISKLPFGELKSILADILDDELGHGKHERAHPNLYDNFLLSIGVNENLLTQENPICLASLKKMRASLITQSAAYGIGLRGMGGECLCQIYLATMHHYFAKNPVIIAKQDQISWDFWDIHIGEEDIHHQQIVRQAINNLLLSEPTLITDLTAGYIESKNAWDQFWQEIYNQARSARKLKETVI
jgi:hypothetical protein